MNAKEQEPERPEQQHVSKMELEMLMARDYLPQAREACREEMERGAADILRHVDSQFKTLGDKYRALEQEVLRLRNQGWAVWLAVVVAILALIGRMVG